MPGTYVYVALGGVSVHELYAVTGLPFRDRQHDRPAR
jgi:hypothetical protein